MEGRTISRGQDYLTTIRSEQYVEFTPELLGRGTELFSEFVTLVGVPLTPAVGNADTIMERIDDAADGKPVRTRVAAFANMSAAPILIRGKSAIAGWYDLYVTLPPTRQSPGESVYRMHNADGGTFESKAEFWPLFELRPLGKGPSIFVDAGRQKVPGFPMNIGSAGGHWTRRPPSAHAATNFRAEPFFYEGEVIITAEREGQIAPAIPLSFAGPSIAKCTKIQAELTDSAYGGMLARQHLGLTKRDANRELE